MLHFCNNIIYLFRNPVLSPSEYHCI